MVSLLRCSACFREIRGEHHIDSGYYGFCAYKVGGRWHMGKWHRKGNAWKKKSKKGE